MLHGNAYYYPLSRAVPAMRLVLVALLVLLTLIPGMTFSPVQTVPAGKGQISTANSKAALASNNATNSPTLGKEPIAPKVGSPEEMPQGLYQTWMQTQNLEAANDSTYRLEAGTGEVQGHNPSQGLELSFQSGGVTINGMNLSLTRIGYQGQTLEPLAEVAPVVTANRVEYQRGTGLTEWYINKAEGLEQGFTLTQAWPGQNGKELILELSLTGGLFRSAGDALTLVSDKGNSTRYGGLYVYDATGQALTSRMEVSGEGQTARILVNLDGAQYPLVIDPLVQQQLLTASDGAASDNFGWFVSLSSDGNTALIGAYQKTIGGNTLQGAAYIFVRTLDGSWTQQGSALTANDGAAGDGFGNSVSLSSDGNTALIGANFKTIGAKNRQGAAYIFVRTLDGNWTQQGSALTANDGAAGDCFGVSVSLTGDGNIAIVGAPYKTVGMNSLQGEAYIFVRSGTTWILQQSLIASDGTANNRFGFAVSLSSDGNTALIGASNKAVGMNSLQGEAYIFVRSGATWILQQPLIASDGAANDWFGNTVSLSSDGNTSLIGAYQKTIGGHGQQGAAYIFVRSGTTWTQQQELTASDGTTSDLFGNAVSLSKDGKTALIGAQWSNSRQGTAYIFKQSGATWTLQQRLTPKDGAANDWFGFAVSLSMDGNTALISSPYKNFQGAAYTFTTQYTTTTLYTDDFSTYPLGSAPTGWVAYGLSANVPTIVNYGGTGKQFQRLTFATSTQATSPSTGSTPVESEYRDYIIKDNLILTAPTVSVKLNINANSGGEGMFLAWQDPLNFISILTDPYFGEFVIWQAVNGNYGAIGGTGRYNLPITLGQDYWIKAQTTTTINGTPKLDVYWSTDGINYTLKASANPASVAGRVGIGHFRGYVPTYFDDFTVSDAITSSATNHPPTANAGGPYNVVVSQTVTLNGSGSDPDGDPLTFAWDLDNNGSFETPGQNVSFSAIGHSLGSQTVGLQVCDNQGACTTTNTTINILTKSTTKIALTGRVLDKAGNGVPGQTIQLSGSVSASTITDPSGNYTLQVAAGNYTLKVSGNNASYLPIPSYYDLTLNSSLNLTQDTILDLPLPIKKISVHVQNQAGTSVANTAIWTTDPRLGNLSMGNYTASGVSYYAPWTNQVTTDASGNADIWLFPSTTITYLFAAVPPSNMLDVVKTEFPGVSVINDTSIVITLNPAPTKIALTGRVLDKAGNGVPRQTVQLSGSGNDSTTTDPSGNYTLRVAAGNYTLKVSGSNASYLPIPSYYDLTLNSS
ncbi:MAG: carboxypeptidase regulatory-like domain-containing protein, partial [Chloroflexota bacterium]